MADETAKVAPAATMGSTLGFVEVLEIDAEAGRARIAYEARMDHCHSGGVVQGGFVSGWIDGAMAHACIARNGRGTVPMTLELKISYFGPTRPGRVIAEAWVEKHGKRLSFYEGRILNEAGDVLAKGTSTIMIADAARVQAAARAATGQDEG